MIYTALIAEFSLSNIQENNITDFNKFIGHTIAYLNKVFSKSLKTKVEKISEDTIQGLFANASAAYLYFRQLQILLYPLTLNCALGEGQIYFEENWQSHEIDGPALYNAKKGLELLNANDATNLCYISFSKIDKYLNMMFMTSTSFDKKSSITINLIKLMGELFFPIYKKDSMEYLEFSKDNDFLELLKLKEEFYKLFTIDEGSSIKGVYPKATNFQIPKLSEVELVDFEILYNNKKEEIINCFWKRGFSKRISLAMNNTTRQNVDKHLEGGIIEQRNLDGAICLLLNEKKMDILS